MQNPQISIIVPVFNAEPFLRRCLNSILQQNFDHFEVLIINDCSTDNSKDICLEFCEADSRFFYFELDKNTGLGNTRNVGIKKAGGKYLLFVDADDWIDKNACANLFYIAEKYQLQILAADYKLVQNHKERKEVVFDINSGINVISGETLLSEHELFTAVWDKFWLKEFLISNHFYFDKNRYFEDLPVVVSSLLKSKRTAFIKYPFYYYFRNNTQSITQRLPQQKHLNDRVWVIRFLLSEIEKQKNKKVKKALKLLLAKQLQPALANLRNYRGEYTDTKNELQKTISLAIKVCRRQMLKVKTVPILKRVLIFVSPKLYHRIFVTFNAGKNALMRNKSTRFLC